MRWLLFILLLLLPSCQERDPWEGDASLPSEISFNHHIRPIIATKCLDCHGPEEQFGGLRLDKSSQVAAITTENSPRKSLLWERIEEGHPAPLPDREKALLWRWIKQGLPEEGHWATLPIAGEARFPALDPRVPASLEEIQQFARSLIGQELPVEEALELTNRHATRDEVLDHLMSAKAFARSLETRLLLLSGIRPPSPDSLFAPYLRWLDSQVAALDFSLATFYRQSLAGDLIPDAGQEGALATAWLRMPLAEKKRSLAEQIGRTFLALDLTEEHPALWPDAPAVVPRFFPDHLPARSGPYPVPPFTAIQTPQQITKLKELETGLRQNELQLEAYRRNGSDSFQAWIRSPEPATPISDLAASFSFDQAPVANLALNPTGSLAKPPILVEGARQLAALAPAQFTGLTLSLATPYTVSFFLRIDKLRAGETTLLASTPPGKAPLGFRLSLSSKGMTIGHYAGSSPNSLSIAAPVIPSPRSWHHIAVSYDGTRQARGIRLFIDGQRIGTTVLNDEVYGEGSEQDGRLFLLEPGSAIDELTIHQRALHPLEIAHLRDGRSLVEAANQEFPREDLLESYYLSSIDSTCRAFLANRSHLTSVICRIEDASLKVPIARQHPELEPRPALPFVPLSLESGANRLGFADWLFSPENPVTARVLANRLYLSIHGYSLIPDPNNIADPWKVPTEPVLLDVLARDLLHNNWEVRRILKTIILNPPSSWEGQIG
ncbi:MAG: DUF1553 domain-containing protein [Verrucomicrobiota bacterium JB023]|nr:DUF1553 domain-containing protein [Verrucomicrobiota bacterium JB023]